MGKKSCPIIVSITQRVRLMRKHIRKFINRLRDQTTEQLSIIKEQTQAINKMTKRIGENQDKESSEIKKSSAYSNMCSYKMKLN